MDDARSRLVASAQELMWERGYTGTSPRAIQDRAGVGQGSMYHHFAGKADLARAAIQATVEDLLPGWRAHLDGDGAAVVREGQGAGDVRADVDADQVAATLVSVIQGGYVLARAHQDEDRFTAAIEGVLALVAAPR